MCGSIGLFAEVLHALNANLLLWCTWKVDNGLRQHSHLSIAKYCVLRFFTSHPIDLNRLPVTQKNTPKKLNYQTLRSATCIFCTFCHTENSCLLPTFKVALRNNCTTSTSCVLVRLSCFCGNVSRNVHYCPSFRYAQIWWGPKPWNSIGLLENSCLSIYQILASCTCTSDLSIKYHRLTCH